MMVLILLELVPILLVLPLILLLMFKIVRAFSVLSLLMTLALLGVIKSVIKCQECFNTCAAPCKDILQQDLTACGASPDCMKEATHKSRDDGSFVERSPKDNHSTVTDLAKFRG